MKKITIEFPSTKKVEVEPGTKSIEIINNFDNNIDDILAVRIDNEICSLNKAILTDAKIDPIFTHSKDGSEIYRRTLCFVMAAALNKIAPDLKLIIGHSLGYGYYYTLKSGTEIKQDLIDSLQKEMRSIVEKNLTITTEYVSYLEAVALTEENCLEDTSKLLKYICPPRIQINTLEKYSDIYFGPLLVSTGKLKVFDLMKYQQGFLLRFPTSSNIKELPVFHDAPQLFKTYERYKKWGKQIGVTSAASLIELVNKRQTTDFINITELFQEKCIADIAEQIHNKGTVKLILIAGPSSSGKTTTSKKLALELQAIGYKPKVISLDNYYVGRERNPKDENGNYDFECLEALDVPLINENLVDLFNGKKVEIPCYNFTSGEREYKGKFMQLEENDILIMEGIHGLNDKLTPLVENKYKFKLYLSPLTQLNMNEYNRISTSDNRLIRRIVRDNNFRGKTAAETISMWDNVQKGERLHIFPFQNNADAVLNTALDYELAVLKIYAEPLLRCISPIQKEYSEACRLLRFLNYFPQIAPTNVPDRSIIREFIGDSAFHY